MNIGERLRKRRLDLGLTLEEVAHKVDISRQTMSRYETGVIKNIPQDKIDLLASALNTSPLFILGYTDDPDPIRKLISLPTTSPELLGLDIEIGCAKDELMDVVEKICGMTTENLNSGRLEFWNPQHIKVITDFLERNADVLRRLMPNTNADQFKDNV